MKISRLNSNLAIKNNRDQTKQNIVFSSTYIKLATVKAGKNEELKLINKIVREYKKELNGFIKEVKQSILKNKIRNKQINFKKIKQIPYQTSTVDGFTRTISINQTNKQIYILDKTMNEAQKTRSLIINQDGSIELAYISKTRLKDENKTPPKNFVNPIFDRSANETEVNGIESIGYLSQNGKSKYEIKKHIGFHTYNIKADENKGSFAISKIPDEKQEVLRK